MNFPFATQFNLADGSYELILAVFRMTFGVIMAVKLYGMSKFKLFIWALNFPIGVKNYKQLNTVLIVLSVFSIFLSFGFLSAFLSLLLPLCFYLLMRRASMYSIEDILAHIILVYFIFAGTGSNYSVDSLLGIPTLNRFPVEESLFPEGILLIMVSLTLFSSGLDKLKSPLWMSGMALYRFFSYTGHRRFNTDAIRTNKWLLLSANYIALAGEIIMFPALLLNGIPLGFLGSFLMFGMGLLLTLVFTFSFLAEFITITTLLGIFMCLELGYSGLIQHFYYDFTVADMVDKTVMFLVLLSLFCSLWVSSVIHLLPGNFNSSIINSINRFCAQIARLVWGLIPVRLFSEKHLTSQFLYRTYVSEDGENWKEIHKIYKDNCLSGPYKEFRPIHIRSTNYKLSEIFMEFDKYGEIQSDFRQTMFDRLIEFALNTGNNLLGRMPVYIRYDSRQIFPPYDFVGKDNTWFENQSWKKSLQIKIKDSKASEIQILSKPIIEHDTGRDIKINTYSFNPNA